MKMHCCPVCGTRLTEREHPTDGVVAWCEGCGDYRFPLFSTAVSVVALNPDRTKMILIRQYGQAEEVLVAGYVDKGETAEHAVRRELMEELGLSAREVRFLASHYYAPSETLMLNFSVTVEETEAHPNFEVDGWRWCSVPEARKSVRPGGLADELLHDLI